jgi:hypothetical protein
MGGLRVCAGGGMGTEGKRARGTKVAARSATEVPLPPTAAAAAGDAAHPWSDAAAPVCVAKLYHEDHGLKLNDIVELIGILTFHHGLDDHVAEDGDAAASVEELMDADHLRAQPSSRVPRLHCLAWAPLAAGQGHPLFGRRTASPWADHARTCV